MENTKPYIDRVLRIFISYSSTDKKIAGQIKSDLDMYGFDTFLAHEDLDFGIEWENQILKELSSCDIFIPILSEDFRQSEWCSQEIGIASSLQKKMLPLNFGINPYGFIKKVQATKISGKYAHQIGEEIINHLKSDEKYAKDLIDTIIRGFVNSGSFDTANTRAKILRKFDLFNEAQISEITRGYLANNQISGGFDSKGIVEKIIQDNKGKIPTELLLELNL